ncbi:MAG: hypothetical protein IJC46_03545 [Clostridia bacterium]|nr:hypothetical protein [Clostridia bacterium]
MKRKISLLLMVVLLFTMVMCGCKKEEGSSATAATVVTEAKENEPLVLEAEQQQEEEQASNEAPSEEKPSEEKPSEEQSESTIVTVPSSKEKPLYLRLQEEVEAMPTVVKKVEYTGGKTMERLTEGALGKHFDYEIYYYGIQNFYIEVDGKTVELREALAADPAVIDLLYAEWKRNFEYCCENQYNYMMKDGGSLHHDYSTFDVLKYNRMIMMMDETLKPQDGYYRDLIIGIPEMTPDDVEIRIWHYESAYYLPSGVWTDYRYQYMEGWKNPLLLWEKDHRFIFKHHVFDTYVAQGTYTIEGNKLICKTDDPYQNVYVFRKAQNGYVFIAAESTKIPSFAYPGKDAPICTVPDGAYFELNK